MPPVSADNVGMVLLLSSPCRFIGEWYEKEPPHHAPTEEQIAQGSRNCFIVGGIYLGWTVFALGEPGCVQLIPTL